MDLKHPQKFIRQLIKFSLSFAIFFGCSKGTFHNNKSLQSLSITIPVNLVNESGVDTFIFSSVKELNSWIITFDEINANYKKLHYRKESENTVYNKVQLLQLTSECLNKKRLYANSCARLEENAIAISKRLPPIKRTSFDSIYSKIEIGMKQIDSQIELAYNY